MLILIIAFFLVGCSKNKTDIEDYTGIKIGPAELNENNETIHNIFNFDKTQKNLTVTTLCYDKNGKLIDNNDSYVITMEPETVSGWKPTCPDNTANYLIDISELK